MREVKNPLTHIPLNRPVFIQPTSGAKKYASNQQIIPLMFYGTNEPQQHMQTSVAGERRSKLAPSGSTSADALIRDPELLHDMRRCVQYKPHIYSTWTWWCQMLGLAAAADCNQRPRPCDPLGSTRSSCKSKVDCSVEEYIHRMRFQVQDSYTSSQLRYSFGSQIYHLGSCTFVYPEWCSRDGYVASDPTSNVHHVLRRIRDTLVVIRMREDMRDLLMALLAFSLFRREGKHINLTQVGDEDRWKYFPQAFVLLQGPCVLGFICRVSPKCGVLYDRVRNCFFPGQRQQTEDETASTYEAGQVYMEGLGPWMVTCRSGSNDEYVLKIAGACPKSFMRYWFQLVHHFHQKEIVELRYTSVYKSPGKQTDPIPTNRPRGQEQEPPYTHTSTGHEQDPRVTFDVSDWPAWRDRVDWVYKMGERMSELYPQCLALIVYTLPGMPGDDYFRTFLRRYVVQSSVKYHPRYGADLAQRVAWLQVTPNSKSNRQTSTLRGKRNSTYVKVSGPGTTISYGSCRGSGVQLLCTVYTDEVSTWEFCNVGAPRTRETAYVRRATQRPQDITTWTSSTYHNCNREQKQNRHRLQASQKLQYTDDMVLQCLNWQVNLGEQTPQVQRGPMRSSTSYLSQEMAEWSETWLPFNLSQLCQAWHWLLNRWTISPEAAEAFTRFCHRWSISQNFMRREGDVVVKQGRDVHPRNSSLCKSSWRRHSTVYSDLRSRSESSNWRSSHSHAAAGVGASVDVIGQQYRQLMRMAGVVENIQVTRLTIRAAHDVQVQAGHANICTSVSFVGGLYTSLRLYSTSHMLRLATSQTGIPLNSSSTPKVIGDAKLYGVFTGPSVRSVLRNCTTFRQIWETYIYDRDSRDRPGPGPVTSAGDDKEALLAYFENAYRVEAMRRADVNWLPRLAGGGSNAEDEEPEEPVRNKDEVDHGDDLKVKAAWTSGFVYHDRFTCCSTFRPRRIQFGVFTYWSDGYMQIWRVEVSNLGVRCVKMGSTVFMQEYVAQTSRIEVDASFVWPTGNLLHWLRRLRLTFLQEAWSSYITGSGWKSSTAWEAGKSLPPVVEAYLRTLLEMDHFTDAVGLRRMGSTPGAAPTVAKLLRLASSSTRRAQSDDDGGFRLVRTTVDDEAALEAALRVAESCGMLVYSRWNSISATSKTSTSVATLGPCSPSPVPQFVYYFVDASTSLAETFYAVRCDTRQKLEATFHLPPEVCTYADAAWIAYYHQITPNSSDHIDPAKSAEVDTTSIVDVYTLNPLHSARTPFLGVLAMSSFKKACLRNLSQNISLWCAQYSLKVSQSGNVAFHTLFEALISIPSKFKEGLMVDLRDLRKHPTTVLECIRTHGTPAKGQTPRVWLVPLPEQSASVGKLTGNLPYVRSPMTHYVELVLLECGRWQVSSVHLNDRNLPLQTSEVPTSAQSYGIIFTSLAAIVYPKNDATRDQSCTTTDSLYKDSANVADYICKCLLNRAQICRLFA